MYIEFHMPYMITNNITQYNTYFTLDMCAYKPQNNINNNNTQYLHGIRQRQNLVVIRLKSRQNSRHFCRPHFTFILSNEKFLFWLKLQLSSFQRVQFTVSHHWSYMIECLTVKVSDRGAWLTSVCQPWLRVVRDQTMNMLSDWSSPITVCLSRCWLAMMSIDLCNDMSNICH